MVNKTDPTSDLSTDRVFFRPRHRAFWVYLVAFAVGLALWGRAFLGGAHATDWAIAIIWVVVLGTLIALLTRRLDLFGGKRNPLIVAAFLWGAVPAISFAVRISDNLLRGAARA